MIEGTEISPGAWVLHNSTNARNMAVLLGEGGAAIINPGSEPVEIDALERFLAEQETPAAVLVYTEGHEGKRRHGAAEDRWAEAVLLTHTAVAEAPFQPVTVYGWEVLLLAGQSRLGLLNRHERILLCGNMLPAPGSGIPALEGGAEEYIEGLESIEALDAKMVVPSQGTAARGKREIRTRIENDRNYALSVARHVATSMGARVALQRVLDVAAQVYEEYPHRDAHIDNIRLVWQELAGR